MLRRIVTLVFVAATCQASISEANAGDDPRFASDFIQGLRARGFYDLALQYLDQLRQDPQTPGELKKTIEYEEGRTLIEEASRSNDPDVSKVKLEQAKQKIEAFVKANPDLAQTTEALVDLAHLLYERGVAEADLAGDARAGNERDAKLAESRAYYENARNAYTQAFEKLNAKLIAYPKFIPADDPRKLERERVRISLMQAELQKSVVDYNEAQTYPPDAKERTELLQKGLVEFEELYKRYRTQMAGFTARMWQGKCFEEMGKLGEATGIYKELLEHTDPALRPLQKQVDYFRIIVTGKRKEYPRAADECVEWLRLFPKDRRSYEALGVQFELAKNILAQLQGLEGPDRDKAVRTATDYLADVVRVSSPFRPEAITLLQKYRPNAALNAADVSKLTFDEAYAQAGQAMSTLAYENAIALLKVAIRKADPIRDPAKANSARYVLAMAEMLTKRYYEAAVVAEHVARNYPRDPWAAKSVDVAMQAIVEAYNTFTSGNRTTDLDHLVELAKYATETWPEAEQADSGRLTIGLVALGRGHYADAIAAFDSVRHSYPRWTDAQTSCGDAHWKLSQLLREQGKAKEADAEVAMAVAKLETSLKARRDARAPDTDVPMINNACDLAMIALDTGKAPEALALLEPIGKKLATIASRPTSLNTAYSRVVATILRAHIAADKVDLAIADMKTLEAIGGAGNETARLYHKLGELLEREIETLKKGNDKARLARTEQAYQKFLKALVASKSGQTIQSLRWAGDNLLKLGSAKEANDVYTSLLNTYSKDPQFLKSSRALDQLTMIRLKQVAALRSMGNLTEAETMLNEILEQNKKSLEAQMEKGHLLDAKAEAKQGKWLDAYNHWKSLALKLANQSPKQVQYYEAWYQAAESLKKKADGERESKVKQTDYALAKTTIASVMRLTPSVGGPELKVKYETLLKQLGK